MKDVFRSGDSSKKFKIAEGQWYRYAPSYVSPAYHLLEGFPFIQEPPSGDLQERVLIGHHDYDQCFQSVQLLQWNSQVKFNVTRSEERRVGKECRYRRWSYHEKKKGENIKHRRCIEGRVSVIDNVALAI